MSTQDHRSTIRRLSRAERFDAIRHDVRAAARSLARSPAFTLIAVVTLGLGIGATTAIFTVVDRVVLRPLPFAAADRLVTLLTRVPGIEADQEWGLSRAEMFYFQRESRALENVGVFQASAVTLGSDQAAGRAAEQVPAAAVSASVLDVLRLVPVLGRRLTADDNLAETPQVVMLGHWFWRQRFGGDPGVVGRTMDINGRPTEIVGVLGSGAALPDQDVDLWIPLYIDAARPAALNHVFRGIARLRGATTVAAAQAELTRLTVRLPEVFPVYRPQFMKSTGFQTGVVPLRDDVLGSVKGVLWAVLAGVTLVLLIACANVAHLFFVRAEGKRRELTIRAALGAPRSRLVWHQVTESLCVCVAAGALGVVLASLGLRALLLLAPAGIPRLAEVRLGWTSVVCAAAVALIAAAAFGLMPFVRAGFGRVSLDALRSGGRGSIASRRDRSARSTLTVAQTAMALVLLAMAGLLLQSVRHLLRVDPGLSAAGVVTTRVALPTGRYDSDERVTAFLRELTTRLEALPGVERAGATEWLALDGGMGCTTVIREAPADRPEARSACVPAFVVAPGYFQTLGIPVRGRAPDWADTERRSGDVVVSRALAARLWPGEDPIGKGVRCCNGNPPFYRVTGVTDDVRAEGLDRPPTEIAYFPMLPLQGAAIGRPPREMTIVVRSATMSPERLLPAIQRVVAELDPNVPLARAHTMTEIVAASMARVSFTLALLSIAAGMALLLSVIGIYAVISHLVTRRRAEIGIRMALGADGARVGRMVVFQSVRVAAIGVGIGVAAALLATRTLRSLLFEISPTDPATLAGTAVILLGVAVLASGLPAWRASRIDPVEAIRAD